MHPPEYHVRCLERLTKSGGDEDLRLEIDGKPAAVTLRVSNLNRQLVSDLPGRALDLMELAALVYGVDAIVSRGGPVDSQMGHKWHRRFIVTMPVRDLRFWQNDHVIRDLEEMLMFLSGDRFEFAFEAKQEADAERTRFFHFDTESAWRADRVLMFSGGLDSFAGALEEIADHRQRVALISHFSATKIAPIQRQLKDALATKFGEDTCKHIPVKVNLTGTPLKEGTHRSRSFLFAALGAVTAHVFKRNRVSFHENGVVSLNLPPVGNVLGTRATRTTHPQTLTRFSCFLGTVLEAGMQVDNPYFWRTKTEVVETIARLGMGNQIAHTRSCADVHNQTKQYVHCGRCSQCIDRRFAMIAARQTDVDPAEAYKVDLFQGERSDVRDREIALCYVRNARAFEHMTPADLESTFPAVLSAVEHLGNPPETVLSLIAGLLKRHGKAVTGVMRRALESSDAGNFPEGSLPRLYGDVQRETALPTITNQLQSVDPTPTEKLLLKIDTGSGEITICDRVVIKRNATYTLLIELATLWLDGAGKGLDPLDYPCVEAGNLAGKLGLDSEEAVRRRVNRARILLKERFSSAALDEQLGPEVIENIPWHGYRLKPDLVVVQKVASS